MGIWYRPANERLGPVPQSVWQTLGQVDGCDAQQASREWLHPAGIGEAAREASFTYAGR